MDGFTLRRELRELLAEPDGSSWLNNRTDYDFLHQAAIEFVMRTECLTASQTITTVADQAAYTLNSDFMGLYLKDRSNRFYVQFYACAQTNIVYFKDYEDVVYDNNTVAARIPNAFTIIESPTDTTNITGVTTSAGASSNGECTLTKSTATFITSGVTVGDKVYNTTDGSNGYVMAVTSETALVTALFEGSVNEWGSGDAFIIIPKSRYQIVFDPMTSDVGDTVTIKYIQSPAPVYSDYRKYRIPDRYKNVLVQYACFLYKYRDRSPDYGDRFYKAFDLACRKSARNLNKVLQRTNFKVNFMKRNTV